MNVFLEKIVFCDFPALPAGRRTKWKTSKKIIFSGKTVIKTVSHRLAMKLIIGLGNPGKRYEMTRHNVGFLFLEHLRNQWDFPIFQEKRSFHAECSEGICNGVKILLARPNTFMNASEEALESIRHFYKVDTGDIIVIHDDLDIPLGNIRASFDSRSAGHRGVEDIIRKLGTTAFLRFRIGIGRPEQAASDSGPDTASFVLDRFTSEERERIIDTFPAIVTSLASHILPHGK